MKTISLTTSPHPKGIDSGLQNIEDTSAHRISPLLHIQFIPKDVMCLHSHLSTGENGGSAMNSGVFENGVRFFPPDFVIWGFLVCSFHTAAPRHFLSTERDYMKTVSVVALSIIPLECMICKDIIFWLPRAMRLPIALDIYQIEQICYPTSLYKVQSLPFSNK